MNSASKAKSNGLSRDLYMLAEFPAKVQSLNKVKLSFCEKLAYSSGGT